MIYRGDIYYANLNPIVGSEQNGLRPVLVIQNNKGNKHGPTVIAAPITSRKKKKYLPTHVVLPRTPMLPYSSMVLLEQIRAMDKQRLREYVGHLDEEAMRKIDMAISLSLALPYQEEEKTQRKGTGDIR